jgi:hypothetical protein
MSSGNFDRESASRISRVVRYVENEWPVGTKRTRRPGLPDSGGTIQVVRLIENVPPAKLFVSTDDFYDQLQSALGERLANTVDPSELQSIGAEIINRVSDDVNAPGVKPVDRFFGSGLAWLCEFDDGRNREALQQGAVKNVLVRFTEVVRVWNMHSRTYNISDIGGAFGNEAGSLGAGYCNVIEGWDGELWLVSPDRRLDFIQQSTVTSLVDTVDSHNNLITRLIDWLELLTGDKLP